MQHIVQALGFESAIWKGPELYTVESTTRIGKVLRKENQISYYDSGFCCANTMTSSIFPVTLLKVRKN